VQDTPWPGGLEYPSCLWTGRTHRARGLDACGYRWWWD
jgi:hypothetical protein